MDELQRAIKWLEEFDATNKSLANDYTNYPTCEQDEQIGLYYKGLAANCRVLLDALRWVPISERLPEHGQPVLVVMGSPQEGVSTACYWSSHKTWSIKATVTHWRPLPAPPQSP